MSSSCSAGQVGGLVLLQVLLDALETPFDHAEIGEDELVLHRLRVAGGVDAA